MTSTITGRLEHWDVFATERYALRAYRTTHDTYAYFEHITRREKSRTYSGKDAIELLKVTAALIAGPAMRASIAFPTTTNSPLTES